MGAAAGADICPGELHNPDIAGQILQFLFAAEIHLMQGFFRRVMHRHRPVFPNVAVGGQLDFLQLFPADGSIIIHYHKGIGDVETHIVAVEGGANEAAGDMLPGVLLHQIKAAGGIHPAVNLGPRLQGGRTEVIDFFPYLLHKGHGDII